MKIYIIGWARHGKDTVGEMLVQLTGLKACSSSLFMASRVVRPHMEKMGITYPSVQACFEDRANHRETWKRAIKEFNVKSGCLATLSRMIFAEYDIYMGIRDREEYLESRRWGFGDLAIWVDASRRVRQHDPTCLVLPEDCDLILDNNGTEDELRAKVERLARVLRGFLACERLREEGI